MRLPRAIAGMALAAATCAAGADSVTARLPVIVYDGPSVSSTPRYLLGKDYPVVIISRTDEWLKICMHDRTAGHIHRRDAVPGDSVITTRNTTVRSDPSPDGDRILDAAAGLLLVGIGDAIDGWLPVRHASSATGFIPEADAWGHAGC